jgi:6-phosphogluconolactonase (cycloisomerase 2 family)
MTGDTVVAYSIDSSTGALTPVAGSVPAAGAGARALALDPTGKFAYTANNNDNTITAVSIDPSTGALSQVPGSPFHLAGSAPVDLAIAAVHP